MVSISKWHFFKSNFRVIMEPYIFLTASCKLKVPITTICCTALLCFSKPFHFYYYFVIFKIFCVLPEGTHAIYLSRIFGKIKGNLKRKFGLDKDCRLLKIAFFLDLFGYFLHSPLHITRQETHVLHVFIL